MPHIENLAQKIGAVLTLVLGVCFMETAAVSPAVTAALFFFGGVFTSMISLCWYLACRYSEGIS